MDNAFLGLSIFNNFVIFLSIQCETKPILYDLLDWTRDTESQQISTLSYQIKP